MAKKEKKINYNLEEANDAYVKAFPTGQVAMLDMAEYLYVVAENTKRYVLSLSDIALANIAGGPLLLEYVKEHYNFIEGTSDDAILTTVETSSDYGYVPGSNMLITSSEIEKLQRIAMLLSDTGLSSLIQRVGASCPAIYKMSTEDTKTVIECAIRTISTRKVSALFRFGKIRGFNGDVTFSDLPQHELFDAAVDMVMKEFNGFEFLGGEYSHAYTWAKWLLPEQSDDVLDSYKEMCAAHGFDRANDLQVSIKFSTSDIGDSCATISAMIVGNNISIYVGDPIKVAHNNGNTIDDFKGQLPQLLAKTKDLVTGLTNLIDIEIKHPVNTVISLSKHIGLSKTSTVSALEEFETGYDAEASYTAHDIFYVLQDILNNMRTDGKTARTTIEKCDENLSRLLTQGFPWDEFDIAVRPDL